MKPTCSPSTVEKLVKAVQCVLDHNWDGYWSFLEPCNEALKAYKKEMNLCKCGKQAKIKVFKLSGMQVRVCWDCFIILAKTENKF